MYIACMRRRASLPIAPRAASCLKTENGTRGRKNQGLFITDGYCTHHGRRAAQLVPGEVRVVGRVDPIVCEWPGHVLDDLAVPRVKCVAVFPMDIADKPVVR
jgi:hypothetical protein